MKILKEYLKEMNRPNVDDIGDTELPEILLTFYTNVHHEDGDLYKLQTLKCICASINCYMKESRNVDIIQDPRFICANEMFHAMIVETKCQGKAVTIPKKVIEDRDMTVIAQHFDNNYEENPDPVLQQNVLFNILYFFICCGHENLLHMKKNWFEVATDPDMNEKFVQQIFDEVDKNHGPKDTKITNEGRMYQITGQSILGTIQFTDKTNFLNVQIKQIFSAKLKISPMQGLPSVLSSSTSSTLENWILGVMPSGKNLTEWKEASHLTKPHGMSSVWSATPPGEIYGSS